MQLAEVPPELRQAYMRLILDPVTIDHHDVRLEGPLVVLEKLSQTGASKSLPEVLSFAREWRAREDSNGQELNADVRSMRRCQPSGQSGPRPGRPERLQMTLVRHQREKRARPDERRLGHDPRASNRLLLAPRRPRNHAVFTGSNRAK